MRPPEDDVLLRDMLDHARRATDAIAVAVEAGVAGAVDLAHPSGPEWGQDLERAQACSCRQRHVPALQ